MKPIVFFLSLLAGSAVYGQNNQKYTSIDEVMDTLYAVISGPAGERNWETFHDLFHENALMGSTRLLDNGERELIGFSPEGYVERNGPFFKQNGFWEEELGRTEEVFGGIAQVFSAYQFKLEENGPIARQGVNSIQLVMIGHRWYITQILWESASESNPLPALPATKN